MSISLPGIRSVPLTSITRCMFSFKEIEVSAAVIFHAIPKSDIHLHEMLDVLMYHLIDKSVISQFREIVLNNKVPIS